MDKNLSTTDGGAIERLCLGGQEIPFRKDGASGFQFYAVLRGKTHFIPLVRKSGETFAGNFKELHLQLRYQLSDDILTLCIKAENRGDTSFKPTTLGLKTGIDCYMERYPEWNEIFFPTLLRCERTHFWGYNMTPKGKILVFGCSGPAASWSLDYNEFEDSGEDFCYLTGGHRIYTWNLHLLNRLPKPERHPLLDELRPHESREWQLRFTIVPALDSVMETAAMLCEAPFVSLETYTVEPGQQIKGRLYGNARLFLSAKGKTEQEIPAPLSGGFSFPAGPETGAYTITARSSGGKESEAGFYVRRPYSWYLQMGREAVLQNPPLHTHHVESFNSLFTILLSRKHFPDAEKDALCEQYFQEIAGKLYDPQKQMAAENPWRIQDSAAMSLLFALRYTLTKEPEDLKKAGHLADFLLSCQCEDGAYYSMPSPTRKTHYTSVTYIARYMLGVAEIEGQAGEAFAGAARRHRESAERAVADLVRQKDNIGTEGEMTFEDGMISCSLLQIAYAALQMPSGQKREQYIETAEYMYGIHRCLTQQLIPDCRMNGATLRFWEAQYNLHIFHNVMNSPCGWTAWKLYGDCCLYVLTGKKQYLLEAMNGLGACMQLVDGETGKLRWGFLCDPYVETERYVQQAPGVSRGRLADDILSEQYADMVSPWHREEVFPRVKWGIDNLVHEIFKCMEEIALTAAYLYEEPDGSFLAFNCRAERRENNIHVTLSESIITKVHCNLQNEQAISVAFPSVEKTEKVTFGWIYSEE